MTATYVTANLINGVRLAYQDHKPNTGHRTIWRGSIILLHGFPQTSHQFRHIIPLLCRAGYRCIAPDYRGAGYSSKALDDFTKTSMAGDIALLISHLQLNSADSAGVEQPLHIVGHDIGGMIAWTLASRHRNLLNSVCWGECPIPGTTEYDRELSSRENAIQQFHFLFHCVADLPEALITGREKLYIEHFLRKITYNHEAFPPDVVETYADVYAQPGAIRCAVGVYRAFAKDAEENRDFLRRNGKVAVPSLVLSGEFSRHRNGAQAMASEVTEDNMLEVGVVGGAAHYLAEENPDGFVKAVLRFFQQVENETR